MSLGRVVIHRDTWLIKLIQWSKLSLGAGSVTVTFRGLKRSRHTRWFLGDKERAPSLLASRQWIHSEIKRAIAVFRGVMCWNMKVMEFFISKLQIWRNAGIWRINDRLEEMFVTSDERKEWSLIMASNPSVWLQSRMYKHSDTRHLIK